MHYIVVDLEWNQPMSFDSSVFRQVGDRLVFEMIQIGAVKVDDKYQVVDSISIPIRPQYYVKIHPRIRKMTQLGAEELADAPTFLDAMAQFTAGPSSIKKTWEILIEDIAGEHYWLDKEQWEYLWTHFQMTGLPMYLLIDKQGNIVKRFTHITAKELKDLLEQEINKI